PSAAAAAKTEHTLTPDVLVVGAGPSGLAAARDLARAGLDVLVVDDRAKLGGQFFKQPSTGLPVDERELDGQYLSGRKLMDEAVSAGITALTGVTVWAAFEPDRFMARSADERWVIAPKRVILATGAFERGVPVPGWTLPGVMTTGAGQTLLRSYQVSAGDRVLIAGNGPLNIQLAAELSRAGVRIVGLVEASRMLSPARLLSGVRMGLNSPGLTLDGVKYLAGLAARRVPLITGSVIERLEGDPVTGVRRATVAGVDAEGRPTGRRRAFDVDAVCLGYGFLPSNDLARSLGCAHDFDAALGSLVTRTDATGRTSIPTVWSIGDSAGVRGAKFAQAQGALAAAAVASELLERHVLPDAAARRAARRNLAFQRGVQGMFAAPVLTDQLAEPETVVCRCESVTHAEVSEAMSDRTSSPGSVKRITRAGMGKCQGRYCGPVLTAMQERRTGSPIGERSGFAPQAPVKPVPLIDVAAPPQNTA
ncbi:FAD-dependent oxidoreductase, partial [Leucobacter soli]